MAQEDIELNLNFENEIKTEHSNEDLRFYNLKVFSDQKIIILYIDITSLHFLILGNK